MTASDPAVLDALYRTDAGLAARQAIYRWTLRPVDLPGAAVAALAGVSGVVVDVGCGNGAYVGRLRNDRPDLRVLGVDLSVGMLAGLRASTGHQAVAATDAAALPLADASVDAALAMHMLYHLPDPGRGAAELRRVVRSGGPALVVTNARDDKLELNELLARAVVAAGGRPLNREIGSQHDLSLEALVPVLGRHFGSVEVTEWRTEIVVPEVAPVVAYLDSVRPVVADELSDGPAWVDVLRAAEELTSVAVRRDGAFRVTGHVGMAVCQ